MEASELLLWMAYWRIEPFGPEREDFRAGTIAAAVYNSQGGIKKKAVTAHQIIPPYTLAMESNQNPQAWLNKFKAMATKK